MKSNKKRILFVLTILTMALVLSCAFVACDKAGTDKTGTDIVADYKVTIHPNNGQGDIVWDITKAIPTITKDGFHIAGYFLDAQLTISTTLESLKTTGITKNIDVYVKWEEHVEATDAAVAPTCTEKGLTEGKHCSKCGKILKAQTEIDALGHDLENHDGQEATCTEKGWKEYVTCKREGCDHTTYEEIPALGHTGGTATCTEQATCSVCGEKYGNTLEHNYGTLIPQTNATCSATGIRSHYKCSSCNKLFADDEHKTEITETDLIIPVDENAHDFGKWTRNDGTETHTRVCSFNNEHSETENCHGGTATCTEQAVCEKCNAKYGKALGHDYQGGVCTRCGDVRASEGLKYSLNSDGNGYTVTGIGSCTDTEIVIPSKHNSKPVTSIGYEAFGGCTGFTSVTIPDSVTSIGEGVFSWCTGLTSITIPDSVTNIGDYAFYNCTGLTSVTIGGGVTSIGNYAFADCTGLTSIIVDKENTKYHSAGNCLIETATKTLILGCKTSVIPTDGSVTSIGPEAFRGCTGLTSVTIGKGVTSIGDYAFYGCSGLTSITIPDSVTSIGRFAFNDTAWYNNQPNGPVYAGKVAYEYKGTMPENTSLTLKEGTLGIGVSAFADCSGLTNITIPDSVTSIGDRAFYGCSGLTSITIPDSVTNIGYMAFIDCEALTSVTIGNSVTSIGAGAFSYCPELISIKVSKNNPKYHSEGNCLIETERKTLVLGCKTSVIPSNGSVTSIAGGSFVGCSDLANITIPNFVTSIGEGAFYGCTGLTSVTIPDSVTSIGEGAFYGCTGLTSITVAKGNTKHHSAGNCLIETATKTLLSGCKTSVIPTDGSVTSIGEGAFYGCTGLTSITIPDSVTSIGDYAFMDCTGLTSITIPDSVTSIGDSAFKGCTGLKSVTIGNGVTSIRSDAFSGCTGLTSITIPDGVTSIGDHAFSGCTSLTSVTIPDSVTSIGMHAFQRCSGLTSITIGKGVKIIRDAAFSGCIELKRIVFKGTIEQWVSILKIKDWNTYVPSDCKVICTDGTTSI